MDNDNRNTEEATVTRRHRRPTMPRIEGPCGCLYPEGVGGMPLRLSRATFVRHQEHENDDEETP